MTNAARIVRITDIYAVGTCDCCGRSPVFAVKVDVVDGMRGQFRACRACFREFVSMLVEVERLRGQPVQRDERAETLADQLVADVNASNQIIARLEERLAAPTATLAAVREALQGLVDCDHSGGDMAHTVDLEPDFNKPRRWAACPCFVRALGALTLADVGAKERMPPTTLAAATAAFKVEEYDKHTGYFDACSHCEQRWERHGDGCPVEMLLTLADVGAKGKGEPS